MNVSITFLKFILNAFSECVIVQWGCLIVTIGQNIKKARKNAGLTQKQLAERSGLATITIQQYERGVREPKLDIITKIARAMGLYAGDLISPGDWGTLYVDDWDMPTEIEPTDPQQVKDARLLKHFHALSAEGQIVAIGRVQELAQIPAYQRPAEDSQSAPGAPDDKEPAEK